MAPTLFRSSSDLISIALLAWLAGITFSGLSHSEASSPPVIETVDGIIYVRNSDVPREELMTVSLEEVWRAGGDDDEEFFGLVPRVETDGEGNVYVLDTQLCHVHVYSPDGEKLRVLFREGEGPGEVRGPRDMLILSDGRVGLVQESMGAVTFVDVNGNPAGGFALGRRDSIHNYNLVAGAGAGQSIILSGTKIKSGTERWIRLRRNFLATFSVSGDELNRLAESDTERNFRDFRIIEREHMPPFWWCFDVAEDGSVYAVTRRDEYAINEYGPDGALRRVITRGYERFERSDEEYQRFFNMIKESMSDMPMEVTIEIERNYPAIACIQRGVQVYGDGTLWVLSERGARPDEPGVMALFDVFDFRGVFIRQVALKAPHDGSRVGIVLGRPGQVIVIKGYFESLSSQLGNMPVYQGVDGGSDPPEVICYKMLPAS